MQTAYACLSGFALNLEVVLILTTAASLPLLHFLLFDPSGKVFGHNDTDILLMPDLCRRRVKLCRFCWMLSNSGRHPCNNALASRLADPATSGDDAVSGDSPGLWNRVIFDVSPESRAEFDCFQPRLKFWLKIRSCHLCRCCSLTFEPQGSRISLTHSPCQNSHFGWSLGTTSTNVVWLVRQGTVSLAMRPSKGMKCHTRTSSTTVQQCS